MFFIRVGLHRPHICFDVNWPVDDFLSLLSQRQKLFFFCPNALDNFAVTERSFAHQPPGRVLEIQLFLAKSSASSN